MSVQIHQNMEINAAVKEKNYGIELLRICTMMIVLLHCCTIGGAQSATNGAALPEHLIGITAAACFGAVNIYGMITGYVSIYSKERRWSRYFMLWLQVFTYSVVGAAANFIINGEPSWQTVAAFFPVMSEQYWYFSSYTIVFFLMPYVNKLLLGLSQKEHRSLVWFGVLVGAASGFIKQLDGDPFCFSGGYSPIWLLVLYVIGAYIRRFPNSFERKKRQYGWSFALCVAATWIGQFGIKWLTMQLLGYTMFRELFFSYLSPVLVLGAMCMLVIFSRIQLARCRKLITAVSGATFGVYLIHVNTYFVSIFIGGRFACADGMTWYMLIGWMLVYAMLIYAGCTLIELLRQWMFRVLRIPKLTKNLEARINWLFSRK